MSYTLDLKKDDRIRQNNEPTYKKDIYNIFFLIYLYILQGVPIGLLFSLPFILSSRKASYSDQGTFSFATWPYSMKLLWAPIVDSVFIKRLGRRKSWLIPTQYLIGICLLVFSNYVSKTLDNEDIKSKEDIYILTAAFFLLTFLCATQDIAVDGWGLTILSKDNLEWATICNNAGATFGILLGNSLFLILESGEFCNKYIRPLFGLGGQAQGLVTIKEFMDFFGVVYIASTTLIFLFKTEKKMVSEDYINKESSIMETYSSLWNIIKLKPIRQLIIILLTCKFAFATTSIRTLKMIEAGVPKEKLGLMNAPFQIVQILAPMFMGSLSNKPLNWFLKIYPMRIIMTVILALWVYMTPMFKDSNNEYPWMFFFVYAMINGIYSLIFSAMSFTKGFFFTQISDKSIGGTYMTLLNTISNIGVVWPATLALYLVEILSFKKCELNSFDIFKNSSTNLKNLLRSIEKNTCETDFEIKVCYANGAACKVTLDAFYFLTFLFLFLGIIWLTLYSKIITKLQSLSKTNWRFVLNQD